MKRFSIVLLVACLMVALAFSVADAAKKKKQDQGSGPGPSLSSKRSFDVAVDIGLPVAGFIPYGSVTGDNGLDGRISGVGDVSFPYFGLHARLYPGPTWFVQFDALNYLRQTGSGTFTTTNNDNDEETDEDFGMTISRFTVLDFGLGAMFGSGRVRPNAGAGLGIHYLSISNEDEDESASGWALGPYGQIGVDFTATKLRGIGDLFFGANLRLDLVWNWKPIVFEDSNTELAMAYLPLSFFISSGLRF